MRPNPIVIIGAGEPGGRAAEALRAGGWDGSIVMIGAEVHAPEERPPLPKEFLAGAKGHADLAISPPNFFETNAIDTRLGCVAVVIDRTQQQVLHSASPPITYNLLLLAMGAEPFHMQLPGSQLVGIHYLCSIEDAPALRSVIQPGTRLAVVGGGLIGMEAAASARARDRIVTVIEGLSRLMLRSVPAEVGAVIQARHRDAGAHIALDAAITAFLGENSVSAVLVAMGARPQFCLATAAGLAIENGVACAPELQTSDPLIYAAGDFCSYPHRLFGVRIRSEQWRNAEGQGRAGTSVSIGRDVRIGEKLIERGARPDPRLLADPRSNLKVLLKGEKV